jgi:predicted MFS family arabinose efflux permease
MQVQEPYRERHALSSDAYAWYVVLALTLGQVLSSVDAHLPYIMVEALKRDLRLSDTQIGLINGPAFSLAYAIFAIPIARYADRQSRMAIIGIAIVVWSGFTAAAAMTRGFGSFALTRVGVAIGESALTPAAHSLIASYLPERRRVKGITIYSFGIAVGAFTAFAGGGYIIDRFGWRMAFITVGAAGVVLAIILVATVREPFRARPTGRQPILSGSLLGLFRHRVVRNVVIGGVLLGFSSGAINGWGPAYVMRNFGLSATQTGASYGAVLGSLAMIGMLGGGFLSSWLAQRQLRYVMQMLAAAFAVATLTQIGALLIGDYYGFLALLAVTVLLSAFYIGPTYAIIQSMVSPRERSFASAVTLLCINGFGIAAGEAVVGVLSDLLAGYAKGDSLKWAMLAVSVMKGWSAWHYWLASRAARIHGAG